MNDTRAYPFATLFTVMCLTVSIFILCLWIMRCEDRITHLEDQVVILERNQPLP